MYIGWTTKLKSFDANYFVCHEVLPTLPVISKWKNIENTKWTFGTHVLEVGLENIAIRKKRLSKKRDQYVDNFEMKAVKDYMIWSSVY